MNPFTELKRKFNGGRCWTQYDMHDGASHCLWGGLEIIPWQGTDVSLDQALLTLAGVINEQYPDRVGHSRAPRHIIRFNDHPDTEWADVEKVLDKAEVVWTEKHDDSAG